MKKRLVILGMITCMLCLAACGETEAQSGPINDEQALQIGTTIVDQMNAIVSQGAIEQYVGTDPILSSGFRGWESALDDIGTYEGASSASVAFEEDEVIIRVEVLGSSHDAEVEIILDSALSNYLGITTNVHYSTGEILAKAGMNTLIGMGTVFAVLILISLIISCFTLISKFEARQKKETPAETAASDPIVEQIAAKEELSDDTELVAVIAAAVAAYEGSASTDGFVVRSIRKVNQSKWQNA
ncbi:MAG: OadG family protein [Bacteroidales bacterium]|nr:OadG family protein [Bacteroidales bacterium]MCM1414327.1 OadG family protein [bacterium]MCM1422207.1 OadG family protein [bacterium]